MFALAGALLASAATAQDDDDQRRQPEPRAESLVLRRAQLRLTSGGQPVLVSFTHHSRRLSRQELDASVAPGARWHPGCDVWPILQTSSPLRFGESDSDRTDGKPPVLPAGRYVATVQQCGERDALVLTRASVIERLGLDPSQPERMVPLDGFYTRLDVGENDDAVANPIVELVADTYSPDRGELRIRLGAFEWGAVFTVLAGGKPVPDVKSERARRMEHLVRRGVDPVVRAALIDPPGPVTAFALDPDSHEDGKGGQRFHGYRVIGQRPLDTTPEGLGAARTLQALLRASILAHPDGAVEDCFLPRHGLRFRTSGGPLDLVICFQCSQVMVRHGEAAVEVDGVAIAKHWEPRFSAQFRELGLRIAK